MVLGGVPFRLSRSWRNMMLAADFEFNSRNWRSCLFVSVGLMSRYQSATACSSAPLLGFPQGLQIHVRPWVLGMIALQSGQRTPFFNSNGEMLCFSLAGIRFHLTWFV